MIRRTVLRTALPLLLGIASLAFARGAGSEAAAALREDSAANFVQELADEVIGVLADESLAEKERREVFDNIFRRGFDLPRIARFVAGPQWRRATDAERREYMRLFELFVTDVYNSRLSEFSGETLEVLGERDSSERGTTVVSQIVHPQGPPSKVEWRVRIGENGYQIVDVVLEGVSMAITQRSEFNSVIRNNGNRFEALLASLRERTDESPAPNRTATQ